MNYFVNEEFLSVVQEHFFPRARLDPMMGKVSGEYFWVPVVNQTRVLSSFEFIDYYSKCSASEVSDTSSTIVDFGKKEIKRAEIGICTVGEWMEGSGSSLQACPLILLSQFSTWECFESFLGNRFCRNIEKRAHKLEKDYGPVRFDVDSRDEKAFALGLDWKTAQLNSRGAVHSFNQRRTRRFLEALFQRRILSMAVVMAKDTPVAVECYVRTRRSYGSWLSSYDPRVQSYGVGRLCSHRLIRHAFDQGCQVYDFLLGNEEYKLKCSTHMRRIGTVGCPSPSVRLWRRARGELVAKIRAYPEMYRFLVQARNLRL